MNAEQLAKTLSEFHINQILKGWNGNSHAERFSRMVEDGESREMAMAVSLIISKL